MASIQVSQGLKIPPECQVSLGHSAGVSNFKLCDSDFLIASAST